jgi:hypothetical protein
MGHLAAKLIYRFFENQSDYIMLLSPFCEYYYCQEWEYHIYKDKVKIIECGGSEYEANWKTKEFFNLCETLE